MTMSASDAAKAVALVEDGRSYRCVAEVLGTSHSSVQRAIIKFRELNIYDRKPGSGRKRKTSLNDDRFIIIQILRNRHTSTAETRNHLEHVRNIRVSERTVGMRLVEANLRARRPETGTELFREHRLARLQFANEHLNWTADHWGNVLFTDESRFCVKSSDGRQRVWRRQGERFAPCTFSSRTPFTGGSIMVWAGISTEAKTALVMVENGSLNGARYIEDKLADHVVPFVPFIGDGFLLMRDNARAHVAHVVSEYLDDVGIQCNRWPARRTDLNPIEHV